MFDKIKDLLKRCRGALGGLLRRARGTRLTRSQLNRLGYYAAVALLLMLLASASYAYRARRSEAAAAPEEPPRAASAMRTPPVAVTPQPTPEPVRWQWPLEGEIIGAYSPLEPVWSDTLSQWQTHPALDIAGAPGEAVYACRDGTVLDAWSDRLWGNVIVLQHADGYQSTYAGLNTLRMVEIGDEVAAGDVISAVGQSASCEAHMPGHLHFEVTLDGERVDFAALMEEEQGE